VDRDGGQAGFEGVALSLGRLSAEGAEVKSRIHGFIAAPASTVREGIQCLATSIACQHGNTFFDPQKRDKKQAEVMIDTLVMGRLQAAAGTNPRVFIKRFGFGLNAGNQKHMDVPCKIIAYVEKPINSSFPCLRRGRLCGGRNPGIGFLDSRLRGSDIFMSLIYGR
jgi:hypothetical protein